MHVPVLCQTKLTHLNGLNPKDITTDSSIKGVIIVGLKILISRKNLDFKTCCLEIENYITSLGTHLLKTSCQKRLVKNICQYYIF